MRDDIETAWSAGLFEGEGCIHVGKKKSVVTLAMCSTDRDVIERFAQWASFGSLKPVVKRSSNHKDAWAWTCSRRLQVFSILERLLPHLGSRRRAKAVQVLGMPARPHGDKIKCGRGHDLIGSGAIVKKEKSGYVRCLVCSRLAKAERDAKSVA